MFRNLIATTIIGVAVSTPIKADENLHDELGEALKLYLEFWDDPEAKGSLYWVGLVSGLKYACPEVAFKKFEGGKSSGEVAKNLVLELQDVWASGKYLTVEESGMSALDVLDDAALSAFCGEEFYAEYAATLAVTR